jgi:hypothetical protein
MAQKKKGMPVTDYTGRHFGQLTVLEYQPSAGGRWLCQCACGADCRRQGIDFTSGERLACNACLIEQRRRDRGECQSTAVEENGYQYLQHAQARVVSYFFTQLERDRHGLLLLKQYTQAADEQWRRIGRHSSAAASERRRHGSEAHGYNPACRACCCEAADVVWRYLFKQGHDCGGVCELCEARQKITNRRPMAAVSFFAWWLWRQDGPLSPGAIMDAVEQN